MKKGSAFLLALSALLPAIASLADDKATAKKLLEEAKTFAAKGNWAEACPKLEEAKKLDPRMVIVFRLAECHEHVGKTASAHGGYLEAAALAKAAGEPNKAADAIEHAKKLEPKLSRVALSIQADDAELTIKLDGTELPKSKLGEKIALDPGEHTLEASAPKKKPWSTKISVLPGPSELTVTVAKLEPEAPPPAPPEEPKWASPPPEEEVKKAPVGHSTTEPPAPPKDAPRTSPVRTVGIVLVAGGVVAFGVSTYFGFAARAKDQDALPHCKGELCDATGKAINDDARRLGNVGTVVFGIGAALAVTGVIVFVAAPRSSTKAWVAPSLGSGGPGIAIGGLL